MKQIYKCKMVQLFGYSCHKKGLGNLDLKRVQLSEDGSKRDEDRGCSEATLKNTENSDISFLTRLYTQAIYFQLLK